MTAKTFFERLLEDRRLVILRLLGDLPGYISNSSVIAKLLSGFGHMVSRDYVRGQIAWLDEQGLVDSEDVDGVTLVTLTERGLDVARGLSIIPGVARPGA